MDTQAIYEYIESHRDEHIAKIQEFLRQPSVSDVDPAQVRKCAELLRQYYQDLGCVEAELVETDGHPGVWAYYEAGAERTIINYCMYDTQPVKEDEVWLSPPFEAKIVAGEVIGRPAFGSVIVARGAINSKGPYRAWLNTLEAIIAVEGHLPVNVMFIAEGEEELGSPHLKQIVHQYRERLKQADAVLDLGAAQNHEGKVNLSLGYKGNVYFDMECTSEAWGRGSRRDVHSSIKPILDSPVIRLIRAVSSMVASDGNTPAIEGLNEDTHPWPEDLELIDKLAENPDFLREIAEEYDVIQWIEGVSDPKELLYRYFYGPNLNINGFISGYTGRGAKTVIPPSAVCKVNIRLVPNQEPTAIMAKIRAHLNNQGYSDIILKPPQTSKTEGRDYIGYTWSKTNVNTDVVQAVLKTYAKYKVPVTIRPHSPGTAPMFLFTQPPLSLPMCSGGLGHGAREHSQNEYFVIDGNEKVGGLIECEKSYVDILFNYVQS